MWKWLKNWVVGGSWKIFEVNNKNLECLDEPADRSIDINWAWWPTPVILALRKKMIKRACCLKEYRYQAGHWWLTLIILATQEAEIRRMAVGSQPRHTGYLEKILHKKGLVE
jgi:hypothetical protein